MEADQLMPHMTEKEYREISSYIETEFGIRMPPVKQHLLRGRLAKRLHHLGMESFHQYFHHVIDLGPGSDEYVHFVDLVSTHETRFFREADHFSTFSERLAPELATRQESLRMLSAACSSGEEAYTMAMVASRSLGMHNTGSRRLQVEGIDLSPRMVQIAHKGIYPRSRLDSVPPEYIKGFFMQCKDKRRALVRIVPELRALCSFRAGNLLDNGTLKPETYDVIFCRNVLIYFEPQTQREVVDRLLRALRPKGYLFVGHSETMSTLGLGLTQLAPAAYRKK